MRVQDPFVAKSNIWQSVGINLYYLIVELLKFLDFGFDISYERIRWNYALCQFRASSITL